MDKVILENVKALKDRRAALKNKKYWAPENSTLEEEDRALFESLKLVAIILTCVIFIVMMLVQATCHI